MRVLGLTGGIACGKSTVARILREAHGVPVIDADRAARDVVRRGEPALQAIVDAFGPDVLAPDGTLDRSALRRRIAHDPDARRALEAITHPAIRAHMAQELAALAAAGHPVAVVEAALLVETGSWRGYDALIVVSCRPDVQLARLVARDGMSEPDARALIASQLPLAEKEAVADQVIRNDGDEAGLREEVERVWGVVGVRRGGTGASAGRGSSEPE